MKPPTVVGYFVALVMIAYLIIAFCIGFALGAIPFELYDKYGLIHDPILIFIFRGIPGLLVGGGLAYLAYLPIRYLNKKTNFFKDNFPGS